MSRMERSRSTEEPSYAEAERQGRKPQVSGDQLTVQTIRDLREIDAIREVWKTWETTRDSNIDYFSGMVRSRGEDCRPHVIVVSRNGRPDALLVGLRDRRKIPVKIRSVTLFQPEVDVLEFVRGGVLGNASIENCRALVQAVIQSLAEGDADLALWEQLDVQSALYLNALQLPSIVLRDHCRKLGEHWFLDYPKGLEAFFRSLGRSQRSKLQRKYKKFQNSFAGKIEVRSFQTAGELGEAIRDMEDIARKSVKRHLGFGFFDTPQSREQLRVEAALGWLRIYILYVDGRPVSFWKGTLCGHCLQSDHVGFDATWSEFSPGIFLFLYIIESLRDSEVDTIDFGTGIGQFYESFAKIRRPDGRVKIFSPKLSAVQLNLSLTLAHYITLLIQKISFLEWPRRAVWRMRKSALARTSGSRSSNNPSEFQDTVLCHDQGCVEGQEMPEANMNLDSNPEARFHYP
jgi:hypothetical protein